MDWISEWVNLKDYTPAQQWLFFADAIFWVIVYVLIEVKVRKYKYLGIPAAIVVANFAWELLFSFVFTTNLGKLFTYGIIIWCFIDIVLVYRAMQYGYKQAGSAFTAQFFRPIFWVGVAIWAALIYVFVEQYTDPIGATTGYTINICMSTLYVFLFLRQPEQKALSLDIAIFKMFGTGFVGLAVYIGKQPDPYVITMASITFLIDLCYCILILNRKKIIILTQKPKLMGSADISVLS